jgi:hypothetical protein
MDLVITSNSTAIKEAIIQSRAVAREASKAMKKARMQQKGRNHKYAPILPEAMSDVTMSSTSGIKKQQYSLATKRGGGRFNRAAAPIWPSRRAQMQDMTTEGAIIVAGDGGGAEGEPKTAEGPPSKYQSKAAGKNARTRAKREARKLKVSKRKGSVKEEKELELTTEDVNALLAARNTPEAEAIALARGLAVPPPQDEALIAQQKAAALATREANRLRSSINSLLSRQLSRVDLSSTPKVTKSSTVGITKRQREPSKWKKRAMAAEAKKIAESDRRVDKRQQALLDAAEALIAKVDMDREQYEKEKEKLFQKARPFRTRDIEGEKLDEELAALKTEQAEYAERIDKLREESKEQARQAYDKSAAEKGEVTEVDELAKMLSLVGMGRKHAN